jgi:hypothetical protein
MTKKSCCCGTANRSCCSPELFNEFVTLVGGTMLTANPVNINDLIILTIKRPGRQAVPTYISSEFGNVSQNCGSDCMSAGG